MTLNAGQFCAYNNFIYANVRNGVLVFERLSRGILIAKTFLLPEMDFPKKGWYETTAFGLCLDTTDYAKECCQKASNQIINRV
jgi:hypothetical protein